MLMKILHILLYIALGISLWNLGWALGVEYRFHKNFSDQTQE